MRRDSIKALEKLISWVTLDSMRRKVGESIERFLTPEERGHLKELKSDDIKTHGVHYMKPYKKS